MGRKQIDYRGCYCGIRVRVPDDFFKTEMPVRKLILFAFLIGVFLVGQRSTAVAETVDNWQPLVFIWAVGDDRTAKRALGTGFVLNHSGDVLTAKSVVVNLRGGERLIASIGTKSSYPVAVDMTDVDCAATQDFCFVRLPADAVADSGVNVFYIFGCFIPAPGSGVVIAGFPTDGGSSAGVLAPSGEVVGGPTSGGALPVSARIGAGMEGGPVFDMDAVVVGLASISSATFGRVQPLRRARSELWDRGIECLPAPGRDRSPQNATYADLVARLVELDAGWNGEALESAKDALTDGNLDTARKEIAMLEDDARRQRADARRQNTTLVKALRDTGVEPGGVFDQSSKWDQPSVRVCFLDGDPALQRYTARIARTWSLYGNIELDFGEGNSIRQCLAKDGSDVRVTLAGTQAWSYIGTNSRKTSDGKPTLSIPAAGSDWTSGSLDRGILHEFGHMLGLLHTYQHPAFCREELNIEFLAKRNGWSRETVERVFEKTHDDDALIGGYDVASIMQFDLPAGAFSAGAASKCYQQLRSRQELSAMDILAISMAYP